MSVILSVSSGMNDYVKQVEYNSSSLSYINVGGNHVDTTALLGSDLVKPDEKIELENVDIYGFGFNDFYCSKSNIENIKIENPEKINILIIHGTLNGSNAEDMQYNSMSVSMLEQKEFNYIALGHIHKNNFEKNSNEFCSKLSNFVQNSKISKKWCY